MRALFLFFLLLVQDPDLDALLKQLSDDSIEVREKATAALVERGEKSEERLRKEIASSSGELKARFESILRAIERNRKLRSVLPLLKPVTIDATRRPLREVLEEYLRQTGLAMPLENLPDAIVTVAVKDAAPLEALHVICKAAGLGWFVDWNPRKSEAGAGPGPGEPFVRLRPDGYHEMPRVFARHYLVAPSEIHISRWSDFRSSASNATLQLRMAWILGTKPESVWMEVDSVTDDQGRSVYEAANRPQSGRTMGIGDIRRGQAACVIQLVPPQADVKSIASVKGRAFARFVVEEKTIAFSKPEECVGQKREYDGLTVELKALKPDAGAAEVTLAVQGRRLSPEADPQALITLVHGKWFRVELEDGSVASLTPARHTVEPGASTIVLRIGNVTSKIASFEIIMDTVYHTDSFDFELKDIPLPK